VRAGDVAGIDRVVRAHPKYVGGDREQIHPERFSLGDAQATIAVETGFGSWRELVKATDALTQTKHAQREAVGLNHQMMQRAFDEARRGDSPAVSKEHLLLAVLNPPEPTVASQVLKELGVSYEDALARSPRVHDDEKEEEGGAGPRSSPAYHEAAAFASALAVSQGAPSVTDEHVLVALLYDEHRDTGSAITRVDLDPDEIYDALAARGVPVPPLRPPVPATPFGPASHTIYFPEADESAVRQALRDRHRGKFIGCAPSRWKPGYWYLWGEDYLDLASMVREVVADASAIQIIPREEALPRERPSQRQRPPTTNSVA
jgi:hypothetical protein